MIKNTYAVIVAFEVYTRLGSSWNLPGAGAQAAEFAEWLIKSRGIPATNVQVFQSGAEAQSFTKLGVPKNQVAEATADSINKFIANVGSHWPQGEVLLLYWIGHGFVTSDGARRLIFADAESNLKTNLDVDQLVRLLRTEQAGSFRCQVAFIDTCAKFFEELQSGTDLPCGGLNAGTRQHGTKQNFYFAASSGEYATQNAFGPRVLELLRDLPSDEWPPNTRRLRDGIEIVFDRLAAQRLAEQQPAWLEYRDDLDNRWTRGVLPTLTDINELSGRAGFPLRQLRTLTELAARCEMLAERLGRDQLYSSINTNKPLNRPAESIDNLQLDLMRLIAGVIEQGQIAVLVAQIIDIESNSDAAFRFARASQSVETLRSFWPLLTAIRLPLARALVLFKSAHRLRLDEHDPGSLEEILDRLMDLSVMEPMIEFLLRAARERPEDPHCRALEMYLRGKAEWSAILKKLDERLQEEPNTRSYLLVEVGERAEIWRVTRSWLWSGSASVPCELAALDSEGDLTTDIASLLNEAQSAGGSICLEILVPEKLLHLGRGRLAWNNRGNPRDPERLYPVTLRWKDRMAAKLRDPTFQSGRWKKAGTDIRTRLNFKRRAYWISRNYSLDDFCQKFDAGDYGELIGIPLPSDGDCHNRLVEIICNGGVPYACWPRCSTVDLAHAEASVNQLIIEHQFDEIPSAVRLFRLEEAHPLADLLLLWDDPNRNPYDNRFSDVVQRG